VPLAARQTEAEAKAMTVVAPALGRYRRPKKRLAVLRAAAVLDRRAGPIEWLSQELAIPRSEACRMLQLVSQAAQELLGEYQARPVSVGGRQQPRLAAHCSCLPVCWNKSNITPSHPGRAQRPLASLSAPRITRRVIPVRGS
jgi:hypothetical protein